MSTSGSGGCGGRLEVVLDRSWEVQSITWSNLTWWDPLPCGQELLASIKTSDPLPLPHPSPALSLLGAGTSSNTWQEVASDPSQLQVNVSFPLSYTNHWYTTSLITQLQ